MRDSTDDKRVERERYDRRASQVLDSGRLDALTQEGAAGIPIELRAPYLVYESHIARHARPGISLLDLCCGDGRHSLRAGRHGATVTVSDIAPHNVELTLARARKVGLHYEGVVSDAEHPPWPDQTFDVITCAGSLSYVDHAIFIGHVRRLLRPGGAFIFVDSLNHHPIYRLNRHLHFLRGRRSRSTLERMPTLATLARIQSSFPDLQTSYHGIFSFLTPVLRPLGAARAARWLDAWDARLPKLGRFAFKVVGCGHRPLA